MKPRSKNCQYGFSLLGFIGLLLLVGGIGLIGLQVVPTFVEYRAISKAIIAAKAAGTSPAEVRSSFDKQANAGYIETITGKDLTLLKTSDGIEVSFAYQKKIPLFGPVSLVIDYEGTTIGTQRKKPIA